MSVNSYSPLEPSYIPLVCTSIRDLLDWTRLMKEVGWKVRMETVNPTKQSGKMICKLSVQSGIGYRDPTSFFVVFNMPLLSSLEQEKIDRTHNLFL